MSHTILSLISSNKHTGPGVAALQMCAMLHQSGHRVLFACHPGNNLSRKAEEADLEVVTDFHLPRNGQLLHHLRDRKRLRSMVTQEQVGLVITHRTAEMLTAALSLPQSFPILRVWHDGSGRPCSSILRRLIRRLGIHVAATSVTATTALGDIACDATGIPRILPGVVDTSQFNPELDSAQLRLDLGFQASDHVVGLTARWKPGRGHEDFLQAFQRASQTAPALRALLIGRGELEKDFGQLIQRLGLAHAVKLFSPGNRFIETLSVCDAAVLMAPGSDGHCRAALEWLSLEKPLFLTQRGALQDFASIEPAICLSCESQEELTAALIRSAQSPQSHQHIAAAGRKHILSCHNEQVVRQHISDLCSELIPVAS